jgi:hypothetical protein
MRVSQGEPSGRKIHLYHPELLNEHEEVVIYTRNEFRRTFGLISEQVDYITKLNMSFHQEDNDWKIQGYWPVVMERVHILGLGVNSFFENNSSQAYLDAHICDETTISEDHPVKSVVKGINEYGEVNW